METEDRYGERVRVNYLSSGKLDPGYDRNSARAVLEAILAALIIGVIWFLVF